MSGRVRAGLLTGCFALVGLYLPDCCTLVDRWPDRPALAAPRPAEPGPGPVASAGGASAEETRLEETRPEGPGVERKRGEYRGGQ